LGIGWRFSFVKELVVIIVPGTKYNVPRSFESKIQVLIRIPTSKFFTQSSTFNIGEVARVSRKSCWKHQDPPKAKYRS
jgi:hypothetical protein